MICAIIVAGGKGERLLASVPKQFLEVRGKPILLRAVERVWACSRISEMIVVAPEAFLPQTRSMLSGKEVKIVAGGAERQDSVYSGLRACSESARLVLVHDGVRPFPSRELIERVIAGAEKSGAAVPGLPLRETIKEVDAKPGRILGTVDRSRLYAIQTPQAFERRLIVEAHQRGQNLGFYATDDAGLIEWAGGSVMMVPGEETNIKITTPMDLKLAELIAEELKI